MVGPKAHVIIQFRTTVYMVSRSSYQPYVIRHVHDLGNCLFASPTVFRFNSNNASYIYPLARSRLWFCRQALHRHVGREWIPLALVLGITMPFAFLFKYLHLGFVCRSLWAYWCASKGAKEKMMFPYWIRRFLFYSIVLLILPMICGLVPFASPAEWKDHFALKAIDLLQPSSESDWSEF